MAAMDSDTLPPPPDTPPGSPFRPEPEQPRPGIIHLLAWTACVAVYFSITTAMRRSPPPGGYVARLDPSLLLWAGAEIARATALGGLLLLGVRRYQRLHFANQPGETLLVLLAVGVAMQLGRRLLVYGAVSLDLKATVGLLSSVLEGSAMVVLGVLYLIAALRTKTLRWRVYFATVSLGGAIVILLIYLMRASRPWPIALVVGALLLALAVLLVVAVKDALEGPRYRWTHWLGVGVALWNNATLVVSFAWTLLLRNAFL